jgi:hypothetical protein
MATLRTWKEAFFNDKVCCPHQRCMNKTAFFNEAGLGQHLFILQDSARRLSKSWPSHDTTRACGGGRVLTEVIFLGPKFSKDGVHADQAKVKAIVEIVCFYKRPVFTTDFWGMINYISMCCSQAFAQSWNQSTTCLVEERWPMLFGNLSNSIPLFVLIMCAVVFVKFRLFQISKCLGG